MKWTERQTAEDQGITDEAPILWRYEGALSFSTGDGCHWINQMDDGKFQVAIKSLPDVYASDLDDAFEVAEMRIWALEAHADMAQAPERA